MADIKLYFSLSKNDVLTHNLYKLYLIPTFFVFWYYGYYVIIVAESIKVSSTKRWFIRILYWS